MVLIHHYCLATSAEFRDDLPQFGQGADGLVDALIITADPAGVGCDAIFQAIYGVYTLFTLGYHGG